MKSSKKYESNQEKSIGDENMTEGIMKRTVKDYLNLLIDSGLVMASNIMGVENVPIDHLTYDSKKAGRGTLFVCKGNAFRGEYLEEALRKGAICFVAEKTYGYEQLPHILVNNIRKAMAVLAREFYLAPEMSLHTIGVTGTKGKTTTTYYIKAMYDEWLKRRHRRGMGYLSSIETWDGMKREEAKNTTPESMEVYRHMRNMCDSGMSHMVMEISSQALKYHRVSGIFYEVGVFLNISEDHISPMEHRDFEDYFQSKLKLFQQTGTAVVNLDADESERILEAAKEADRIVTFGTGKKADIRGYQTEIRDGRIHFRVSCDRFDEEFELQMHGLFNVENALAAIAVAYVGNVPVADMKKGLRNVKVPGRMEEYVCRERDITAIVDYAHNGLSFRKIFDSVKIEYPGYHVVSVFGCPGGKALNRRRDTGLEAGNSCSRVYISADDPGVEPVEKISREIADYIETSGCPCICIDDRETAIRQAIADAQEKTVVLVLGKGSESSQKIGKTVKHYKSDAAIVRECLINPVQSAAVV